MVSTDVDRIYFCLQHCYRLHASDDVDWESLITVDSQIKKPGHYAGFFVLRVLS
jgi:hypothetical protein